MRLQTEEWTSSKRCNRQRRVNQLLQRCEAQVVVFLWVLWPMPTEVSQIGSSESSSVGSFFKIILSDAYNLSLSVTKTSSFNGHILMVHSCPQGLCCGLFHSCQLQLSHPTLDQIQTWLSPFVTLTHKHGKIRYKLKILRGKARGATLLYTKRIN